MKDFVSYLTENINTVAIVGHIRPDGDCVGSCMATYNYISTYYPKIVVDVYLEPIPTIFNFLKNTDKIQHTCENNQIYDICIVQDCGDVGRLGNAVKYFKTAGKTICIDHHISNENFADENHIFPLVSSTSELVFELIGEQNLTKEIAECIYVGIVHDTGVFQFSSTTARTMNIAGKLMETGIDFTKIVDDTFFTKTFDQNKIMGRVLLDSELYLDHKCIIGIATLAQMAEYNVLPKHLNGIVNQLRVTKDVEVAVFLYETENGDYKVSMRSNGKVDVAAISMKFKGGGHKRASGFTLHEPKEAVIEQICQEIEKQLFH
ncbi:bifunctional oligoribonuclease/PAP phosphatase NrnA [Lachnospiraceae bacterium ZAX-1]